MSAYDYGSLYDALYYKSGCGADYSEREIWAPMFRNIAKKIVDMYHPKTFLDVGCAWGYLVEALRDMGIEAYGVDVSEFAISKVREDIKKYCFVRNVANGLPTELPAFFDVISTIEVAEHLHEEDAKPFLHAICSHTDKVIFSSTPDDHDEKTHFNVQNREYWVRLFAEEGFRQTWKNDVTFISRQALTFERGVKDTVDTIWDYECHIRELETTQNVLKEKTSELLKYSDVLKLENRRLEDEASESRKQIEIKDSLIDTLHEKVDIYEEQLHTFESGMVAATNHEIRVRNEVSRKEDIRLAKKELKKLIKADNDDYTDLDKFRYDFTIGSHALYTKEDLKEQREYEFDNPIVFSILVPIYNTAAQYICELLCSVKDQTYPYFELCMADGSDDEHGYVGEIIENVAKNDKRIKYVRVKNTGISGNTNCCLDIATGDWIVLLDHDDLLHPSALFAVAKKLEIVKTNLIYTDEAVFRDIPQNLVYAYHKPDYAPDDLLSTNYFCHMVAFKRDLLHTGEGLRSEYDGSQDHDLVLRLSERAENIVHIPEMLYYWRNLPGSASFGADKNSTVYQHGLAAVQAGVDRRGMKGKAENTAFAGYFHVKYEIEGEPLVSIVICNKDNLRLLKRCISSIMKRTSWRNYEIIICENGSVEDDTFTFYESVKKDLRVKIITCEQSGGFNFSKTNNIGVSYASGDYILLLNNDVEILSKNWIEEMLMFAQRKDVGAVGSMLLYSDGSVQHSGIMVCPGHTVLHLDRHRDPSDGGNMGRLARVSNVSAVTGACMMVRREVWNEIGGFDETFKIAYNDIDLCMRLKNAGYLIIFTPHAKLYHYEGQSRGHRRVDKLDIKRELRESRLFHKRYAHIGYRDRYYNLNFNISGYYIEQLRDEYDIKIEKMLKRYRNYPIYISDKINPIWIPKLGRLDTKVVFGGISTDEAYIYITDTRHMDYIDSKYSFLFNIDNLVFFAVGDDICKLKDKDAPVCDVSQNRFLGVGFHQTENNCVVWSGEPVTQIYLTLTDDKPHVITLHQGYSIPLDELDMDNYPIQLLLNERYIKTIYIDSTNNGKDVCFEIKQDYIRDGVNILKLISKTWTPLSYGAEDVRYLGYSIKGITIDDAMECSGIVSSRGYELGKELRFCESDDSAHRYIISGFGVPEVWGAWSDYPEAVIILYIPNVANKDLVLCLNYSTYHSQRVEIYINSKLIDSRISEGETIVEIPIAKSCIDTRGVFKIKFIMPDAVSPKQLLEGTDERKLAIGMYSMKIYEKEEKNIGKIYLKKIYRKLRRYLK